MKKQSLTKGFAVLSAASIIVKIMSLLYIPVLIAIIGEEGNGIYAAANQVYVFIYVIVNSGIPVAISKSISELTAMENYKDALRTFKIARSYLILLGLVLGILMFITAKPVSMWLHFDKSFLAIAALSPTLFITAVVSSYRGYFQGYGNMTPTAVSQVIEQIVNIIFTILFTSLLMRISVQAACAGATVGTSLGALAAGIYLIYTFNRNKTYHRLEKTRGIKARALPYKHLANKLLEYSIPITICVAAQYAGNLIDLWNTKGRLLAAGFEDQQATIMYSYLSKYQQLMNAPISIAAALAAAIFPIISAAVVLNDTEQVERKTNYAFRLCFLIAIPSAIGFSVLSGPIYSILKYGGGHELMMFGSVVLVFASISQIQTSILQGAGRLYRATFYLLLGIVAKIVVNYFLIGISVINVKGAIIGSIVGFSIPILLNTIEIKKHVGANINLFKQAAKPFISSVIMGMAVWIVHKAFYFALVLMLGNYVANALATVISVLAGVVVFMFVMIFVKGITKEDLADMPTKLRTIIPKKVLSMIK